MLTRLEEQFRAAANRIAIVHDQDFQTRIPYSHPPLPVSLPRLEPNSPTEQPPARPREGLPAQGASYTSAAHQKSILNHRIVGFPAACAVFVVLLVASSLPRFLG
ncbi:hypothetical protein Cenrod_1123 [Candidatus Symbiobacter mobilis CR]|uniref:Uncharacterized protein n=1 Tax=Candidatus Symbiobacter mobilis CR TaxID=946483 RepID=U5N6P7_9BURK|nr:hypothetical protein Cenrod_1123 [Candidatus Symbiobacter mobilis CR]